MYPPLRDGSLFSENVAAGVGFNVLTPGLQLFTLSNLMWIVPNMAPKAVRLLFQSFGLGIK